MTKQVITNFDNKSKGAPVSNWVCQPGFTIARDAGRTGAIADMTLMSLNSSGELIPLDDSTAVNGEQIPVGILRGSISEADVKSATAADRQGAMVYVKGDDFDEDQIVLEGSVTLDDSIRLNHTIADITTDDATNEATAVTLVNAIKSALNASDRSMTIRAYLQKLGIFMASVDAVSGYENS